MEERVIKKLQFLFYVLVVLDSILILSIAFIYMVNAFEVRAMEEVAVATVEVKIPPSTATEAIEVIETPPVPTEEVISALTPTILPTIVVPPPINGFNIQDRVDMASGLPIAATFYLENGESISSSWAKSIAFNGTDDPNKVFSPFAGTVYSFHDEVLATWMHSGRIDKDILFALRLEEYILGDIDKAPVRMEKGLQAVENLSGARMILCQVPAGEAKIFGVYDPQSFCPGNTVEFELVAAILIPRENVAEFDSKVLGYLSWLRETYPDAGFDLVKADDGFMMITCVGQFYDQPWPKGDSTPSYQFNRLVLGFRLVEEP